jgi:DNA gyrase subunit B
VKLLRRLGLDELVEISERRGVRFVDMLAERAEDPEGLGRLPTHRLQWDAHDLPAWSEEQAHELAAEKHGLRLADDAAADDSETTEAAQNAGENGAAPAGHLATLRELHENRELERLFAELSALGLSIEDWALVQEESVTGARLPARFAWETTRAGKAEGAGPEDEPEEAEVEAAPGVRGTGRIVEAANLAMIVPALREIGRRGMEIKRFKGLGEMDAEQLWETTMDPARRTMMRVTWDMGQEAEYLFSTLMGEHVEPRRKFIEDHALEVKNLDV